MKCVNNLSYVLANLKIDRVPNWDALLKNAERLRRSHFTWNVLNLPLCIYLGRPEQSVEFLQVFFVNFEIFMSYVQGCVTFLFTVFQEADHGVIAVDAGAARGMWVFLLRCGDALNDLANDDDEDEST